MTRKLTPTEEKIKRELNLDHDMRAIDNRLGNIETSLKTIEGRDAILVKIQYDQNDHEKRLVELEKAKTAIIRLVLGSVAVALLATVIGARVQI